jgi:hypothetical protein
MAGFNDNYSLEAASDGREFSAPDIHGNPVVKMTVRHAESDVFRRVKAVELANLSGSLAGVTDEIQRARLVEESVIRSLSCLVCAWDLDEECTQPAVLALLTARPYLVKWLDAQSVRSADFFGKASVS